MGQMYDVELLLRYNDRRELVEALDKFSATLPSASRSADMFLDEHLGEYDIYNRLLKLVGGHLATHRSIDESGRTCLFTASFHGTYSWESVLWNLMDAIAPALEDDSYIKVYPDVGCWKRAIKDHQILGTEDEDLERSNR